MLGAKAAVKIWVGLSALMTIPVYAVEPCEPIVGRLASAQGQVEVQRASGQGWQAVELDMTLCQGDTVRAGEYSRAAIALINETVLRIDQRSAIRLVNIVTEPQQRSLLSLLRGALQSFSRKPRQLQVDTPYLNGVIEGTEFVFRITDQQTVLTVFEGQVLASNAHGRIAVSPGEAVIAKAGAAPQPRTVVRPRDAVQWALYYPPLLDSAKSGDLSQAFASLRSTPLKQRDARFYHRRAALLLHVGRVEQAQADIARALAINPQDGQALALQSVIHIVRNDKDKALADAQQSVMLSPQSVAAKIALSYAQQAHFDISAARDTMLQAVAQQPNDSLAWARLAELWLMLGERDKAVAASQQALSLAPDSPRAQMVARLYGFG